jgi:hypothetical protein
MKNSQTIGFHDKLRSFPKPVYNKSALYPDKAVVMESFKGIFHQTILFLNPGSVDDQSFSFHSARDFEPG